MSSKVIKVISAALLAYLIIMAATVFLGSLADEGVILDAWYAMLERIPFGGFLAQLSVSLFGSSFHMGSGLTEYLIGVRTLTALDFFEDLATLMLTAVLFEAVNNFLLVLTGTNGGGASNILMRMIIGMVSVLLCTFAATLVLSFLCRQLALLSGAAQWAISSAVNLITVGGAIAVMYLVLGAGIGSALAYVFLRIILINGLKVAATYTGMLLILLFLSEKAYLKMFSAFAGWGVVIVMLIGADILLSSVFDR